MKKTILGLIFIAISLTSFSQEENLNKILDEFLFGKNAQDSMITEMLVNDLDANEILKALYNYSFIYVRSDFENKTFFSGQNLGIEQFNIAGQVYYQGSRGLNLGIAGIMYSKFDPKYNTTILMAGYNNSIAGAKGLSIRSSYNRYIFAKVDSVEYNAFNSSANLGLTYQVKGIGTSADISLLMGREFSVQTNWDIFSEIPLVRFGTSNKITLEPEVSFYFGNETILVNQYIILPRFSGEIYTEKKTFGLRNTMIRLPVSLSLGMMDLSAAYNFNFPRVPGSDTKPDRTSFFSLSLGYIFGL